MNDIRLRACPFCGGQPVALVARRAFDNSVVIQCSCCGVSTGFVLFRSEKGAAAGRDLLPDLATARRHAAEAWNGKGALHGV